MSAGTPTPRSWSPTRLGAFFCRSGEWTIEIQDALVSGRSTKGPLEISLTRLARVEVKPGIVWSKVTLVPSDGSFRVAGSPTAPPDAPSKGECKKRLQAASERVAELQRILYAHDKHSVLLVFQAMDAAGKDSTIRHVLSNTNPAGCQVFSFKAPSPLELDHDFLWRSATRLPERGRIGVFNRSYYEEVLVVRVHPEYLGGQNLPDVDLETVWDERMQSIRDHEAHLARNGTVVIKFWLNVGRDEQKARFLARLDRPEKNWKFNAADVAERQHWPAYMAAYEQALNATSRPWAPWLAIPADNKPYARMIVAETIADVLSRLDLQWPEPSDKEIAKFAEMRRSLESE